jgi:bifunctional non-homologous end joining protein LigD
LITPVCDTSTVEVSNPDKLIFEEAGFDKADLVAHYELVAPAMLEFVADRPLTLQRFPNGVSKKGFMQKNASAHFPDTIRRYEVEKQDGGVTQYPVVDRVDDIAYLANQGTITFHMWLATIQAPERPDWFVIDLDPSEGDLEGVRAALFATRRLLADFGVEGFPMATGSSGFHLWVKLDGERPWDEISSAARAIGGLVAVAEPESTTVEFLKKNRNGRVFVDWLRNNPGATVVAPFSLRPRPNASVAVPLEWDEVASTTPDEWTLGNVEQRLDRIPNLPHQRLPVSDIVARARECGVDVDSPFDRFGRS